jgi:exosortase D (VPLPA-CTERM-specific)
MFDILKYLKMIKPASWLKGILYGTVILAAYYSVLRFLILHDWALEDYSHCYLIPFVFLYLIWEKRKQLVETPSTASWLGFIPFVFGVGLFWLGELGGEFFTMYISLWLVFVGLLWIHTGWQKIKIMAFPIVILLAMFPFPNFINTKLLLKLKLISSQIGVSLLQLYGMSAYREGNVIDLGFTQLQVVDACSGLRYVLPLLILSLLLAHWFKAALWKRIVLVLSSIPLAVFVNSLRIALTGILYRSVGAQAAEGFFHDFSGWLIFIFTLGVLLIEMWILKKIERKGLATEVLQAKDDLNIGIKEERMDSPRRGREGKLWSSYLRQPRFMVALFLLALTLILSHSIEFREKIPSSKPFHQFPIAVGVWEGTRQLMEPQFLNVLDLSDYTIINFESGGRHVDFYVAYYESQRKGQSIHSPETCLPGSGWIFRQAGQVKVAVAGPARFITVNRAIMEKNDAQQVSYFWFPMRGRILTSLWQAKLYTFWDALTRQRTDGALVRIITPVYSQESVQDAEARLQKFTSEIVPVLDQYLSK